ncbi:L,D-transpeptidase family protein [Alsobacter sp. KACC 23698]|uniref:L,D-transpeptidase family protein n=1 Tax=Alsobacter sp. KACC 23698 TaxID=3149229 RepID=A0AAU7JGZ7_9HYPH
MHAQTAAPAAPARSALTVAPAAAVTGSPLAPLAAATPEATASAPQPAAPAPTAAPAAPAVVPVAPAPLAAVAPTKPKPPGPPPEVKISQDPSPSYHADSVAMILAAAQAYGEAAARGGWATLPEGGPLLKPGAKEPLVAQARARLAATSDIAEDNGSDLFDRGLAAAVRRFQARHGLPETGLIGPSTIRAMNVPAEQRQRQLLVSAQRLQGATFAFGPRHIVVNIPAAAVEAVENGVVARRYVAVVGDPDHPSPVVEAKVGAINFHPTWTVPVSIIRKEIIPKMRKDPTYLAKQNIRILDAQGQEVNAATVDWSNNSAVNYTLRQDSGASNSLGIVRIQMPNSHAVYMHDTPSKRFFGQDFRFLSHGCVRVSGVLDLVTWLLGPQGWTRPQVDAMVASTERKDVRLPQSVPVAWVYMTGFVAADGAVNFRDDVYGLDKADPADPVATSSIAPRREASRSPAPAQ